MTPLGSSADQDDVRSSGPDTHPATPEIAAKDVPARREVGTEPPAGRSRVLTQAAMQQALTTGAAAYLSAHVTDFITFDGTWWVARADHQTLIWIRIDDIRLSKILTRYRRRMSEGLFATPTASPS